MASNISILTKRTLYSAPLVLMGLWLVVMAFYLESYWPLQPYIDTQFSTNFDETQFDAIQPGDSTQEVLDKLGEPIWKIGCGGCWEPYFYATDAGIQVPADRLCNAPCEADYQTWQYSDDGACKWGDFAWKEFGVTLQEGKVAQKFSQWNYN